MRFLCYPHCFILTVKQAIDLLDIVGGVAIFRVLRSLRILRYITLIHNIINYLADTKFSET